MSSRSGELKRVSRDDLEIRIGGAEAAKTPQTGLIATLALWWHRRAERKRFAEDMRSFPDTVFKDFGLTRAEAQQEVRRPFWRP